MKKGFLRSRNRRAYPRSALEFFGEVFISGESFPVLIKDSSSGGLGVVSDFYLPPGKKVKIKIQVPMETENVNKEGVVVWSNKVSDNIFYSGVDFYLFA